MSPINRRNFIQTSVLGGVAVGATRERFLTQAPAVRTNSRTPVVISSGNGNRFRNGGDTTCVEEAFRLLTDGADVLDALLGGVNINENDPEDASVGYGGLPNADGIVQLDACCMHGTKKRAGGVAALEGVRAPSLVAKAVMENTDHHLLVGNGAQRFARTWASKSRMISTHHVRENSGWNGSAERILYTTWILPKGMPRAWKLE